MSCLSPSGTVPGAEFEPLKAPLLEPLLRRRVVLASAHAVLALTLSSWQAPLLAQEREGNLANRPFLRPGDPHPRSAWQCRGTAQPPR
jgi:hypothetical protein